MQFFKSECQSVFKDRKGGKNIAIASIVHFHYIILIAIVILKFWIFWEYPQTVVACQV